MRGFTIGLLCGWALAGSSLLAAAPPPRTARLILEFSPQDAAIEAGAWRGSLTLRSLDKPAAAAIVREIAGEKSLVFDLVHCDEGYLAPGGELLLKPGPSGVGGLIASRGRFGSW